MQRVRFDRQDAFSQNTSDSVQRLNVTVTKTATCGFLFHFNVNVESEMAR